MRGWKSKVISILIVFSWGACFAQAQSVMPQPTTSQKMKSFLVACGFGTAAGASLGAASLAFMSNPGDNLQNIAKGASLGLYAGILWGYYNVVVGPEATASTEASLTDPHWMIQPEFKGNQVQGAQIGYVFSSP